MIVVLYDHGNDETISVTTIPTLSRPWRNRSCETRSSPFATYWQRQQQYLSPYILQQDNRDTKDVSLLMEEVEAATSSAVTSPPATATTTTNSDRKTNTTTDITSDGRGGECMGGRGRWETNAATIIPATTVTPRNVYVIVGGGGG